MLSANFGSLTLASSKSIERAVKEIKEAIESWAFYKQIISEGIPLTSYYFQLVKNMHAELNKCKNKLKDIKHKCKYRNNYYLLVPLGQSKKLKRRNLEVLLASDIFKHRFNSNSTLVSRDQPGHRECICTWPFK